MTNKYLRYGVGLDTGKELLHACIGAIKKEGGFKIMAQKKFKNSLLGFDKLISWLSKHVKEEVEVRFLLEVTGVYHEHLLYFLYKRGYKVSLEPGSRVKNYLKSIGHKSKTDKLDGKGMSQMVCERSLSLWSPVSKFILQIRGILRHRKSLQKMKVKLENQLHAQKHSHMKDAYVIKSLGKMIRQLIKQINESESKAEMLAKKDEEFYTKLELTIREYKGMGLLTALTILSETNGFSTFKNKKQLESYAGYDIVENSSGKYKGKTRISKKGNSNIRSVLYMAALSAVRAKSAPFYSLYTRLVARNGGIKKKANVAVQRKMLVLFYTLWKKNEAFNINYHLAA